MKASEFIAQYVKSKVATSQITAIQDSVILPRIKSEQLYILNFYKWRFLKTQKDIEFVSGKIDFPANFGRIYKLVKTSTEEEFTRVEVDEFSDLESGTSNYAIDYTSGEILCTEDGDFRVYYYASPEIELKLDSEVLLGINTPHLETLYDMLGDGVVARMYKFYQKYSEAGVWAADRNKKMRKLFAITRKLS